MGKQVIIYYGQATPCSPMQEIVWLNEARSQENGARTQKFEKIGSGEGGVFMFFRGCPGNFSNGNSGLFYNQRVFYLGVVKSFSFGSRE